MDERTVQDIVAGVLERHGYTEDEITLLYTVSLGVSENGQAGMVSYNRPGTDKRVKTRIGRFVRAHLGGGRTDTDIQQIGAEIIALLWVGESAEDDNGVRELAGEDLREFYLSKVSGIHSCMAYGEAQGYLDIYVDNPDVVKLAAVRIVDQAGRALVWTFPSGKRYMDRRYGTGDSACLEALKDYASRNEIGTADQLRSIGETVTMRIRDGADSHWPYMDSMTHMTLLGVDSCRLSTREGDYELTTTDGYLDDDSENCSCCGENVRDNNIFRGLDDEIYCEGCYDERYTSCAHCGEPVATVDAHETDEGVMCNHCHNLHYHMCPVCEEECENQQSVDIGNGDMVCPECAETFAVCGKCGTYLRRDSAVDGLCSDCAMSQMEETVVKAVEVVQAEGDRV